MRYKKYLIFLTLILLAADLRAQQTPASSATATDVSGRYEGTADVQPFGKLKITGEIRQKEGKLSGAFQTPLGDAPIIEGTYSKNGADDDGVIKLTLDAGGDDIFFSGRRSANGKIVGEIKSSSVNGSFELNRTGDVAAPETERAPVLQQSAEKWRADLRFFAAELPKRHKNAFHRTTRLDFERAVAEFDRRIPQLSDENVILEMSRLAASVGDGHTGLRWYRHFPAVPIKLFWFGKQLRVTEVAEKYARARGARLVKIGGVPVDKIYEKSRPYISAGETEQFVLSASAQLFAYPVFLKNLGAAKSSDAATYEFLDAAGKRFALVMNGEAHGTETVWRAAYETTPLSQQKADQPFYYEHLPDAKTVYVNFRWYPRRREFTAFSKELFDFIDRTAPEKIVFDFRQNGGGDYTRGRDFFVKPLKERKQFLEKGKLFAVVGRVTYSAGMTNAADFRNDLNAIIVGEPTGARPVGYMEGRTFTLPNSGLSVGVSVELAKFAPSDTPGILPDKLIEPDWQSFLAGRDRALEWILNHPKAR